MAPTTCNQNCETKPNVLDVSTKLEMLESIKVMSNAYQLAAACKQVCQLQEQLEQTIAAS
jgi:hypothetical protein